MPQTKSGNRIIVIGGPAPRPRTGARREPAAGRRATPRRIVLISNGELVGGRPGRCTSVS
jgi:hypothetical protein